MWIICGALVLFLLQPLTDLSLFSYLGFHPFFFNSHSVMVRMVLFRTYRTDTHMVGPTVNLTPVRKRTEV